MPMFVALFWGVFLCADRKNRNTPKRFLALFMFVAAVLYATHCAFFNHETLILPYTDTIYAFAALAVYPLYYLYIKSLTGKQGGSAKDFAVLLPGVAVSITTGVFYACGLTLDGLHLCTSCLFAGEVIVCLWAGIKMISSYNQTIHNYYSNTENKTFGRIQILLVLFVVTSLLSMTLNILGKKFFLDSSFLLLIPSLLFSVMLYLIGFAGYLRNFYAADYYREMTPSDEESEIIISEGKLLSLREQIASLVESEQLFLNPNLKVQDIVDALSSNRNYVYKALSTGEKISFSEFINRYRVSYAIKLHASEPTLSTSEISMRSGFSSEQSFYRNFKLITGTTPQKYVHIQS